MKKNLLTAVFLTSAALMAAAQDSTPTRVISSTSSSSYNEEPRFQASAIPGNQGFFWINTMSGDLWRITPPNLTWEYLGSPRGATPGHKGTYQLLADRGAVFILNTDNGEGWWTDGTTWKIIGELSRREKKTE